MTVGAGVKTEHDLGAEQCESVPWEQGKNGERPECSRGWDAWESAGKVRARQQPREKTVYPGACGTMSKGHPQGPTCPVLLHTVRSPDLRLESASTHL